MRTHHQHPALCFGLAFSLFLLGENTRAKDQPAYNFLERSPARIAVIPGVNKTDQPGAPIVLDKAWEEALKQAGFEVVSADRVVTYVAARGMLLTDLPTRKPAELGQDLKVELLLTSEILRWETSTKGDRAASTVEVVARIMEAATGAIVWEHHWVYQERAANEGFNKLIDAAIDTATDKASRMAERAVMKMSADKLPRAGHSPTARRK